MSFSAASLRAVLDAHAPAGATGLVVALSGGADSASLLAAAAALGATFRGLPLARGAYRSWPANCGRLVSRGLRGVVCFARHSLDRDCRPCSSSPPGASIEAAAREARYTALALELKAGECLLTAHHSDDQAETLLLQALRGAGLKGMSAMPVCRPLGRGWHLRPVLDVPQGELLAFGAGLSGVSVTDPMNEDLRFDRGYLRRRVWPLIKSRWPGVGTALSRAARHAAEAQQLLDRAGAADVGRLRDGDALSVPGLRALGAEERINALRFWLREAGVEPPSTARLKEALRQIFEANADHLPPIAWGSVALRRYRQRVFLTEARPPRLEGTRRWCARSDSVVELGPGLGELRWVAQTGGIEHAALAGNPDGPTARGRRDAEARTSRQDPERAAPVSVARRAAVDARRAAPGICGRCLDCRWGPLAGRALVRGPGRPGCAIDWRQGPIIV